MGDGREGYRRRGKREKDEEEGGRGRNGEEGGGKEGKRERFLLYAVDCIVLLSLMITKAIIY